MRGNMLRLLANADVIPTSLVVFTLNMEAIRYSEKSVLARAKGRNIPENDILHSHRRENLKTYLTSNYFGDYFTPMMEVILCYETPVLIEATWRNIPDEGFLYFIVVSKYFTAKFSRDL
jgi:hypothetical protein